MNYPPMLATDRLELRPLEKGDEGDLLSIFSHPEVTEFYEVDTITDPARAGALLDHFIAAGRLGIRLKGNSRIIGSCGLFAFNPEYLFASLGYELEPEFWGKGLMSEALRALLGNGFSSLNLNRVNALTYPDNARSIRLLEKLGFKTEGVMREFGFWKGGFHDMSLHALLRRDWRF